MDHTHEYDCIVCGVHFDSQQDLVRHNEQHIRNASGMERPRDRDSDESDRDRGSDRGAEDLGRS